MFNDFKNEFKKIEKYMKISRIYTYCAFTFILYLLNQIRNRINTANPYTV